MRIWFLLLALLPAITFEVITAAILVRAQRSEVVRSTEVEVESVLRQMESIFVCAKNTCASLQDNAVFQQRMRNAYSSDQVRFSEELEANFDLETIVNSQDFIYGIYLLGTNGFLCKSNTAAFRYRSFSSMRWFTQTLRAQQDRWYGVRDKSYVVESARRQVLTYCTPYFDHATGQPNGVMIVDIDGAQLKNLFSKNVTHDGVFLLLDEDYDVAFRTEDAQISSEDTASIISDICAHESALSSDSSVLISGGRFLSVAKRTPVNNWLLVGSIPTNYLNRTLQPLLFTIALMTLAIAAISILGATYYSRRFTQPILTLQEAMRAVEEGDLSISLMPSGENEIAQLTNSFNHMVIQMQELVNSIYESQSLLRRQEFQALQAQINPHFLYNSLDSTVWLLRLGRSDDAIVMLQNLTTLFRIALSKGREIILIQAELQHLQSYITIQSIRYSKKFSAEIHCPEALKNYLTPKLILQPLVENAIYHGISVEKPNIHIRVVIAEEGGNIRFTVQDNGTGMSEEELARLRARVNTEPERADLNETRGGYGLHNINERIKIYYGPDYGLTIDSEAGVGTMVSLVIPKRSGTQAQPNNQLKKESGNV